MTFLTYRTLIIAFLFPLCACSGPVPFEKETALLEKYLEGKFKESLPEQQQCYLVIPDQACNGCVKYSQTLIENCPKLVIIATPQSYQGKTENRKVLIDREGQINRMALGSENVSLIITERKRIIDILSITPNTQEDKISTAFGYCK